MTLPEHLLSFREKLEDYLKVEDILETEDATENTFKLTKNDLIIKDLQKLTTDKDNLKYQLGNEQYYLRNELQVIIDQLKDGIRSDSFAKHYSKQLTNFKEYERKPLYTELKNS